MFTLSKLVWLVLEPSNLLAFAILAGVLLTATRWRRGGLSLALAGCMGLLIAGFSPLGNLLLRPLEAAFAPFVDDGQPVKGIIVLGGSMDGEVTMARGQMALNEAGERITALVGLARRYPEARIVFSGGSSNMTGAPVSESDALEKVLADLLPDRVPTYERFSRNTRENATLTFRMLRPKPDERWLLVTSAWHMPRSVALFRKAGWSVTPYPVDYRTTGGKDDYRPLFTVGAGLKRLDVAANCWIGLVVAYLSGQSDALWPAPAQPAKH